MLTKILEWSGVRLEDLGIVKGGKDPQSHQVQPLTKHDPAC